MKALIRILVLCILAGMRSALLAQGTVTFADRHLELAVRNALGKPTGTLTTDDLQSLTTPAAGPTS
jgi:hypothetical protein